MATKQIAWNTGSGNIILTYQGQGNGTIAVSSDDNNGAARSQVITVETLDGAKSVNLTINQAACPVPVGTVLNYSYTGSYQEVELPAGQYKLQCWGAQGGSNGTNSSYGITAKAGGKGGYSEGTITLTQKTTLRVYVGGQGSASTGGFNGGGSTTGTAQYNYNNEFGYSKMGGGGGATDIRLSDGALLSRMIVAGGGSGGAMCYKKQTTETTITDYVMETVVEEVSIFHCVLKNFVFVAGTTYHLSNIPSGYDYDVKFTNPADWLTSPAETFRNTDTFVAPSGWNYMHIYFIGAVPSEFSIVLSHTETSTTTSNESQVGYVGGGTTGGGYSSAYQGKQNAAGSGGSFGQGANQTITNYRYCSGAGGGGWYGGGGGSYSDSSMTYCKYSGGGSGFVNTASSASYRPSGYTGLQLDSGTTYAGSSSFPSTGGGTEIGHSGNGYARITRLA